MITIRDFKDCNNFGKLIILIGCLLLVPLIIIPFYPEEINYAGSFLIPGLISIIIGVLLCVILPSDKTESQRM